MHAIRGGGEGNKRSFFFWASHTLMSRCCCMQGRVIPGNTYTHSQEEATRLFATNGHRHGFWGEKHPAHTRDESTFSAVFPNLHFKVTHSPRNYVQGLQAHPAPSETKKNRLRTQLSLATPAVCKPQSLASPGGKRGRPYLAGHLGQAHPRHLWSRWSAGGTGRASGSFQPPPTPGRYASFFFIYSRRWKKSRT